MTQPSRSLNGLFVDRDGQPDKALRLKILRPVFETVTIKEELTAYLTQEIKSSARVFELFSFMKDECKEHFLALHLNAKNCLICLDHISCGSLSASVVHPREVFKSTLLSSAAGLILLHNHPSGDPTPSREDIELTHRLKEGAELLGLRLLDHVIIGEDRHYSLADHGIL